MVAQWASDREFGPGRRGRRRLGDGVDRIFVDKISLDGGKAPVLIAIYGVLGRVHEPQDQGVADIAFRES